jgi:predicted O-methyltransferase YrrM
MRITHKHLNEHKWFNYPHFYERVAKIPTYKVYVELGCWKGHSTAFLAKQLKEKEGAVLYAIDFWDTAPNREGRVDLPDDYPNIYEIYLENIKRVFAPNLVKNIKGCTWEAASQFEDDSVDFIYIDADHTEKGVTMDIKHWWPKLKKHGIMAGHDYHPDNKTGVGPAVRKIFKSEEIKMAGEATVWEVHKQEVNRELIFE